MVETTNTLIDSSNRDLIISGGQFTHFQCHHTNITINIRSEDIHHNGRDSRSMRHSCLVSSSVHTFNISDNASSFHHDPQSQVAHSGDIPQMSAVQSAFINNKMARSMMQQMDCKLEFSGDNEEQNAFGPKMYNDNTTDDDILVTARSQSDFSCLPVTMEERVFSSSQSVLIQESSSTALWADKIPSHIINQGGHTEVDNDGPPSLAMEERVSSSSRSALIQESSSTAVGADKSPGPPSLHQKKRKRKSFGPSHRSYRFDKCHVFMNSFNTRGVKFENSANYAPRVTHRSGTAVNEGPSSSSKLSRPKFSIRQSTWSTLREDSSSYASIDSPSASPVGIDKPFPTSEPDSTFGSPSPGPLPFQLRDDSSTYTPDNSRSAPSVGIDFTYPKFDRMKSKKRKKQPATVDAKLRQLNLHGIETQPYPINSFLPMRMGLHPDFLSHILQPFPDDALDNNTANDRNELPSSTNLNPHQYSVAPDSSQHQPDATSNSLEYHLHSALAILLQTSGTLADGVTPQARNTLKAINALVSTETPTRDPPFKVARKAFKWLQIPRSPK